MIDAIGSAQFLSFSMPPLQIAIRGTIMYWLLLLLFRFVLRRDTSSAGISGVLFLVLLGDAAQNAMIGKGHTVADGVVLIGSLAFWNYLLDFLGYYFRIFAKLNDPPPILLIRDGHVQKHNLRAEHLTRDELEAKLRSNGVDSFEEVKSMHLESDGSVSVVKKRG